MKKIALFAGILLLFSTMVFAQKSNVKKAYNRLWSEPIDYTAAQAEINLAKVDSTTAEQAKTWYVAGRIGYALANEEYKLSLLGKISDADRYAEGLDMMYVNYLVADKFDGIKDKKGRVKYKQRKNIVADFTEMHDQYINVGAVLFEKKEYKKAFLMFDEYVSIADLDIFTEKNTIKVDSTYNKIKYYAALAAIRSNDAVKGEALLLEVKSSDYKDKEGIYELLVNVYQGKEDTVKILATLKEGIEAYPANKYFVGSLVNHYIAVQEYEEAINYLSKLSEENPGNLAYMNTKAAVLLQLERFEDAKAAYQAVLDIDAKDVTALVGLGKSWAFAGDAIQDKAQDLTNDVAYSKEVKRSKESYTKSIEYFEPAYDLMAKENVQFYDLLQNMKVIYLRLEMTDKYKKIDEEMQAL